MTGPWHGPCLAGVFALGMVPASNLDAAPIVLPSGAGAEPLEPVWDEDLSVIRLRFVVERLREPASLYAANAELVFEDMLWLCETQVRTVFGPDAVPQDQGWVGAVITLMDREVEFGVVDSAALQFFEWFSFTMDGCEIDLDEYHD